MKRPPLSLTLDPLPGLIWRIAVPTSVGMLFNTLFNVVDTACAGWLGTDALAGMSVSFPLYFTLIAVGSGLGQGATALLANALGAQQFTEARQLFAQSVVLSVVSGLGVSILGFVLSPFLFHFLGASGEYLATALKFMTVIWAGGVFFVLTTTLSSALACEGETRPYRDFLVIGFLANCLLDPILMLGLGPFPRMGVAGIALATVLVQVFGSWWLWKKVSHTAHFRDLEPSLFIPQRKLILQLVRQSGPSVLNMMTIALGVFVVASFARNFGKEALAAMGIGSRVEQIVLMPAIGLGTAMVSIAGQNSGAGLPHRIKEAWILTVKYGVGLMCLGGALVWFLGPTLFALFNSDSRVAAFGSEYLKVSAFTLAAYPILFSTVFLMQGLKRPAYGLWIGIFRQLLAPFIFINLLIHFFHLASLGVWLGFSLATWTAAVFALWWGWRVVKAQESPTVPKPTIRLEPKNAQSL